MHDDLIRQFSEFSTIPLAQVRTGVTQHAAFTRLSWADCPELGWREKLMRYERDLCRVFELLGGDRPPEALRDRYQREGHWEWLVDHAGDVLVFGAGLGTSCRVLHGLGHRVTYLDADGAAASFARWSFEQNGSSDIEMLLLDKGEIALPASRGWDLVLCDSALESRGDPVQTIDCLARAVRPGGLLYLILEPQTRTDASPARRYVTFSELVSGSPALGALELVPLGNPRAAAFRRTQSKELLIPRPPVPLT
ncbi:MAG: class I SAM-dependent methyltransferase [Planctomycetota bacterium]